MSDANGSALCDGDAEQVREHDDVHAISTGGQRFVAEHVDEKGDQDLGGAVRELFPGGGEADFEQVFQFGEGEGPEVRQREAADVFFEQDGEQDDHGYAPAGGSGYGGPLGSQFRSAEFTENEGVVPGDVQDVDDPGDDHGVDGFVGAAQRGGQGHRDGLEKGKGPDDAHVAVPVVHQFGAQAHPVEDGVAEREEDQADGAADCQVNDQGYADDLYDFLFQVGAEVLGTEDGGAQVDDFKDQEGEHDDLVDHPDGRYAVVRVLAEHDGVHRAEHHDEESFDKNGHGQPRELAFYGVALHLFPFVFFGGQIYSKTGFVIRLG